jgi:DNA polymerase-3 subunit beta
MQFTIPRDTILPVLGAISRTARPNSHMQQLGFVQVTAKEGMLRLFATNLKWSVTHEVPCAGIMQAGQGAISAKLVTDFVGEMPPDALQFTWHADNLMLDLACRGYEAHLHGWNPEELPTPPIATTQPMTTLAAPLLRTLIESMRYAAADDPQKVLSNVLFHFHGTQLTLVGADGFRLVVRTTSLDNLTLPDGQETADLQILVPASVAAELASSLPESKTGQEVLVTLAITPDLNHLVVQAPGWEFAARLADGKYADYAKFIADNQAGPTQVRLVTADLTKALRIAESFAADHHAVVLELLPAADPTEPGQIRLGAASERGSTLALLDAVIEGDPLTITFNTKFLREALANLGHPNTMLRLRAPTLPALVQPANAAGPDHVCLLMPLIVPQVTTVPPAPAAPVAVAAPATPPAAAAAPKVDPPAPPQGKRAKEAGAIPTAVPSDAAAAPDTAPTPRTTPKRGSKKAA